jgi:hypothetical protein
MRITIDCPECGAAKRPLVACAACGAEGGLAELPAWREGLHARSTAIMLAEPHRDTFAAPVPLPRPLRVVLDMDDLDSATETLIVPDTVALPANPLSFDWDERRGLRRLRKSA